MIGELVSRGIGGDRFIYKGWGGEKPIADNATEEGKRLNRRVEITILD
jgi:outer membrane protein OmpA-like peptidoglycan-associated protein